MRLLSKHILRMEICETCLSGHCARCGHCLCCGGRPRIRLAGYVAPRLLLSAHPLAAAALSRTR